MKAYINNIIYDIDLPESIEIEIPKDMENKDEIADYVSDKISEATGFCHKGFDLILADSLNK